MAKWASACWWEGASAHFSPVFGAGATSELRGQIALLDVRTSVKQEGSTASMRGQTRQAIACLPLRWDPAAMTHCERAFATVEEVPFGVRGGVRAPVDVDLLGNKSWAITAKR